MLDPITPLSAFVPKHWLEFFDVTEIVELPKQWQVKLVEKEQRIPLALLGRDVVLDGYMNPVEIEDFPLRGKQTYLTFHRRRWKERGSTKGVNNTYNFHPAGMKATSEFGTFLKGLDRRAADLFRRTWPSKPQ
jgi:hypothetical protein